ASPGRTRPRRGRASTRRRARGGSTRAAPCSASTATRRCSSAGLRALLLQSLHPLAMAGVAAHSGYRGDPWGRLQRTSTVIAVTTFGTADDAERAVGAVRAVHERVRGVAPDGRPYRAGDPDPLRWVHVA